MDLASVGAGFSSPVLLAQKTFRRVLDALARPGRLRHVASDAQPPRELNTAAAAVGLALLDADVRVWCSPGLARGATGPFLRFHTGCHLVDTPAAAHFALIASPGELPPLDSFSLGSDEYPDRSATLVVQVESLVEGRGWSLAGPGVRGARRLEVAGLRADFLAQWSRNHKLFPRGVDLILTCGDLLCGLPRAIRLEA